MPHSPSNATIIDAIRLRRVALVTKVTQLADRITDSLTAAIVECLQTPVSDEARAINSATLLTEVKLRNDEGCLVQHAGRILLVAQAAGHPDGAHTIFKWLAELDAANRLICQLDEIEKALKADPLNTKVVFVK